MFVFCECCVSDRGLYDELITRPEKSHRLRCVLCDLETSTMRKPCPTLGRSPPPPQKKISCTPRNSWDCRFVTDTAHSYRYYLLHRSNWKRQPLHKLAQSPDVFTKKVQNITAQHKLPCPVTQIRHSKTSRPHNTDAFQHPTTKCPRLFKLTNLLFHKHLRHQSSWYSTRR
jgi:hypothetical protein